LEVIKRRWPHLVPEGADAPVSTAQLREAQAQDDFCARHLAYLLAQAGEEELDIAREALWSELSPKDVARVVRARDEGLFAVREGLLCGLSDSADGFDRLALPVLPLLLRSAALTALHDTILHPGRGRTLAVVAARY
jgi:hypothetical protein